MIKLYSTHCPKCHVLEQKMTIKNIPFETIDDVDAVVELGKEHNITSAPILDVDGDVMDFTTANKYLMSL